MRMARCCMLLLIVLLLMCFSTALALELQDGEYAPVSFSFAGGTGKVQIICPRVMVREGRAEAEIVLSSRNYSWISVDGVHYEGSATEEGKRFVIPAVLDEPFVITGQTTAMSVPHEIEYTLHIHMTEDDFAPIGSMSLRYAREFTVTEYPQGIRLIEIADGQRFYTVPEGVELPAALTEERVLYTPVKNVYLAATSAMALICRLDALDNLRFAGSKADAWYTTAAVQAMEAGKLLFAGKYSAPDYELLLREGCGLAVESTMILHSPKVSEMLELIHIPVLIDRSSYETNPLARMEWIRLYGILFGREEEAEAFMSEQEAALAALTEVSEESGARVAFGYLSTDGTAVVRGAEDAVPWMIRRAGGVYAFDAEAAGETKASLALTPEAFYAGAYDAEYLVYNAATTTEPESLEALLSEYPVLSDLRAVRDGKVFLAGASLYQATDAVAEMTIDFNRMIRGEEEGFTFLRKLR